MTWISLIVIVILFYAPVVGLADSMLPAAPLLENYLYLGIGTLLSWVILSLILLGLEQLSDTDVLGPLGLDRGFVYALSPRFSLNLPTWLAGVFLAVSGAEALLTFLLHIEPRFPLEPKLIALSALILVGAVCFDLERNLRFQSAVTKKQRQLNDMETAIESRALTTSRSSPE